MLIFYSQIDTIRTEIPNSKSKPQLNAPHNVQRTNSNVLLQFYSESKMKVTILFTSITCGIRGPQLSTAIILIARLAQDV